MIKGKEGQSAVHEIVSRIPNFMKSLKYLFFQISSLIGFGNFRYLA